MQVAPPRVLGASIGLGLAAAGFGMASAAIFAIGRLPVSGITFGLVLAFLAGSGLAFFAASRVAALLTASYSLDRNAIRIKWGRAVEVIPLPQVQAVRLGLEAGTRFKSSPWRGLRVGTGEIEGAGKVEFFAANAGPETVLILAEDGWFAISPPDPGAFLEVYEEVRRKGVTEAVPRGRRQPALLATVWADLPSRLLLTTGFGSGLALLAFLTLVFPSLPASVPLHFGPDGLADVHGLAGRLFLLPAIVWLTWITNLGGGLLAFGRPGLRPAAYCLWGGGLFVHGLVWAATFQLFSAI